MKFSELPTYAAILEVSRKIENPGSDKWVNDQDLRIELTRMILDELICEAHQDLIEMWMLFRKGNRKNEVNKKELAVQVAKVRGSVCFYASWGGCSADVTIDRILPGIRGGEYEISNCVLACSYHNCQRGDKSIEDYIAWLGSRQA